MLAFTIIVAVLVAAALEIILLLLWIVTECLFVPAFFAPKNIDTDFFKEEACNGIPYILDRGVPYKGSIDSGSIKQALDCGWKFSMDTPLCSYNGILGDAETVNVPHCYNLPDGPFREYRGAVWYEKAFELKREADKPIIRLSFMGSFLTTDVWLDGVHLGQNTDGYLPFYYDISEITDGIHKLVVKVDNSISDATLPLSLFPGHRVGWHHYSGIHREVYIEQLPAVTAFKLSCIPEEMDGKWVVNTSLLLERKEIAKEEIIPCELKIVPVGGGKAVASASFKAHIYKGAAVGGTSVFLEAGSPELWSSGHPALYEMELTTPYEKAKVSFGFRRISWGGGKIRLNGKEIFLKGVCRHEDSGVKGLTTDKAYIEKELGLIRKANGNFVRLAHYPHSAVTLDLTDKTGMLAWDEIPFYQAGLAIAHNTIGKDGGNTRLGNFSLKKILLDFRKTALSRNKKLLIKAAQSAAKLCERDINHPSIITWSVGNEVWSLNKAAGKALGWLRDRVRKYDTSRAVNYAAMCTPGLSAAFEASFKYMDWACINEYYGWYYGKVAGSAKLAAAISRKYPDKPLIITETGSDTKLGLKDSAYPPLDKHSENYQVYYLEETWKGLLMAPTFSGMSVWVLKDFPCPEYGDKNPVPYYNLKGLFDKDLNEKAAYKALASLYGSKK